MPRVVVPKTPGVLSAFGLLVSNIEHDQMETFAQRADAIDADEIDRVFERLSGQGQAKMCNDGVPLDAVEIHRYADMRYVGQSYELTVELPSRTECAIEAAVAAFHAEHHSYYGHSNQAGAVEFVNLRTVHVYRLEMPQPELAATRRKQSAKPATHRRAYFDAAGFVEVPIYARPTLKAGDVICGPAIVEQTDTTVIVYPGMRADVRPDGCIVLEVLVGIDKHAS